MDRFLEKYNSVEINRKSQLPCLNKEIKSLNKNLFTKKTVAPEGITSKYSTKYLVTQYQIIYAILASQTQQYTKKEFKNGQAGFFQMQF